MKKKQIRNVKLTTADDVRRLLSNTVNRLRKEEIDIGTAKAVGYLSSILLKTLEFTQLEKEISNFEKELGDVRGELNL